MVVGRPRYRDARHKCCALAVYDSTTGQASSAFWTCNDTEHVVPAMLDAASM